MNIDFIENILEDCKENHAVITPEKAYTYEDINQKLKDCLRYLDEHGVDAGSVTGISADYSAEAIALLLALIKRDCIIVPISKTLRNSERLIEIAQCESVFDCDTAIETVAEAKENGNAAIRFHTTGVKAGHKMLLGLKNRGVPGLILFSSGTTGEPKAALHDLSRLLEKFKRPGKSLKTISFLLFDHIGGFNTLLHTISHGGTIVTTPSRMPEAVCAAIEKEKIELLPTTPTFLTMVLLNKLYERYDLSCLKMITYGTESMPEHTLKLLSAILPHTTFKQTYGLSEVGILSTKSEDSGSLWMKVGGEGYETKVVSEVLFIRAESAMTGYLNAPSPFDEEGWFDTKDRVERKDGYLKILGRTTDLINVGGEKVYPIEIESVLLQLDGVLDARVYGEKNPIMGNTVAAEVLVAPDNNNTDFIKALRNHCGEHLEKFKRPVRFFLTESILCGERLKKKR
ncbi:MAG: fadD [Bacillota bacterium]|jgi:acyl-CoA synthetase (AMP-forming)/AMP-acid ligase II|nr:fadD [Bacillota bacterium]